MPQPIHFDETKFQELMLYIAKKCEADGRFGATKLNKILFFADFSSYMERGVPITGADYQKLEHGPAPRHLIAARNALVASGAAHEVSRAMLTRSQRRLVATRDPNLSLFSGEEIAIVDRVIDDLRSMTAQEVSDLSHELPAWKLVDVGESIPYYLALISKEPQPLTDDEVAYGQTVAAQINAAA